MVSVSVDTDVLNIRTGPGTAYRIADTAKRGRTFEVDPSTLTGGFVSVGLSLWASWQYLKPIAKGTATVTVNADLLNVRAGPGTNYPVVDQLARGAVVSIDQSLTRGNWLRLATPDERWISAQYVIAGSTAPAPPTQPAPPPAPQLPWTLPISPTDRGVHGNAGGWIPSDAELASIRLNNIRTVLIVAWELGQARDSILRLRNAGVTNFILRAEHHNSPTTKQHFLDLTIPVLREYVQAIGTSNNLLIAIHNEPNLYSEGLGSGWSNGAEFAAFWTGVAQTYRNLFPGCKLGYPALSPGGSVAGVRTDEHAFESQSIAAIRACDWIGLHAYWENQDGSDFNPEITHWQRHGKPIIGTEIGPVNAAIVTPATVGRAYQMLGNAGIPCMAWILNGTGQFSGADWTKNNLNLANPSQPPTPAPQPTPQPGPGVVSKLGIHVETTGGVSADILNTATRLYRLGKPWGLVVVIDDVGLANALVPVCRNVIFRAWAAGETFDIRNMSSVAAAQAEAEKVWRNHQDALSRLDKRVWIQTRNEEDPSPLDYAYECRIMDLAKAQGFRAVIYGYSPGRPEVYQWQWHIPALRQAMKDGHAVSLHEYSAFVDEKPSDTPLCDVATRPSYGLRHRMLYASVPPDCRPKLFNSETGLSTVHMDSIEDIEGYCNLLNEDDYVDGMSIYGYGASVYNLNGQLAALEQLRMRQN